jgi:Domain of unknown function (DUF4402)
MRHGKYLLAALAAFTVVPASAQSVTPNRNADGKGLILVPLTLTKLNDLDFGTLVPSAVSGFVSIDATTGNRTVGGGVTGVPSAAGHRATFGGAGTPNQLVIIAVTPPAELTSMTNPLDKIPVLALTIEGSPVKTVDPTARTYFFGVGGVIQINANQNEGLYQATFNVTANYL